MALTDYLFQAANRVAADQGLVITAESNITPPVAVYDARSNAPSLLDSLGIQTYVKATTADGRIVAEYGTPVQRDPMLMVLYGIAALTAIAFTGSLLMKIVKRKTL